jgi:hypothetical protein
MKLCSPKTAAIVSKAAKRRSKTRAKAYKTHKKALGEQEEKKGEDNLNFGKLGAPPKKMEPLKMADLASLVDTKSW